MSHVVDGVAFFGHVVTVPSVFVPPLFVASHHLTLVVRHALLYCAVTVFPVLTINIVRLCKSTLVCAVAQNLPEEIFQLHSVVDTFRRVSLTQSNGLSGMLGIIFHMCKNMLPRH